MAPSRRDRTLIASCITLLTALAWRHFLGCCWALMGVLFVVGVMNLAWVGILTAFIFIEKLGPLGTPVARVGGAALIALGVSVVLR